ncbi:hypothetical protein FRX31_016732, partial [Thalictrum thalictroides]
EFCVQKRDRVEYIAMLAIFGLIVTMSAILMEELRTSDTLEALQEVLLMSSSNKDQGRVN